MANKPRNPRILIVTPEITYLPDGMGNLAGKMSAKAGGMADVSASLTAALFSLGSDVHVALPHYRRMFHVETAPLKLLIFPSLYFPLGTIGLFSMLCCFCFIDKFIFVIFLDSTYE